MAERHGLVVDSVVEVEIVREIRGGLEQLVELLFERLVAVLGYHLAAVVVERTLLLDLGEIHGDLLAEYGDRIAAQTGHHHGAQVGNVRTLAERGYAAADSILQSEMVDKMRSTF